MAGDLSDTMLMAYVDGELNERDCEAVARAAAAQPEVARRLEAFVRSRQATREAFAGLLASAPPTRLVAAILPGRAAAAAPPVRRSFGARQAVPLAAALLVGIGLGAAFWGTAFGPGGGSDLSGTPGLLAALARQPGGAAVSLGTGTLTVTGTYPTADGTCRTFSVSTADGRTRGVGCDHGQGWRVELLVAAPGDVSTPAADAATATVEAFLEGLGAGSALAPEEEIRLLSR